MQNARRCLAIIFVGLSLIGLQAVAAGASSAATPRAASSVPLDNPPCQTQIDVYGSPGIITFTLHVTYDGCGWPVRAYCDWLDNNSVGPTITAPGSSKTDCEGPATYGWEWEDLGVWTKVKMGSES